MYEDKPIFLYKDQLDKKHHTYKKYVVELEETKVEVTDLSKLPEEREKTLFRIKDTDIKFVDEPQLRLVDYNSLQKEDQATGYAKAILDNWDSLCPDAIDSFDAIRDSLVEEIIAKDTETDEQEEPQKKSSNFNVLTLLLVSQFIAQWGVIIYLLLH